MFMETKLEHMYCKICNEYIDCSISTFNRLHLKKYHPEYNSKKYYDKFLKEKGEDFCFCGNKNKYRNINSGYYRHCSIKCKSNSTYVHEKRKQTCLKKYGVENITESIHFKEKRKQTYLKKYGVENPMQSNKIKEKAKKTNLKLFGVENVSQSSLIKEKKKFTCLKNYNVENPQQSEIVHKKTLKTLFEKYGVDNISKHPQTEEKRKKTIQKRYGVSHYSKSNEFRIFNEKNGIWIPNNDKTKFEIYSRLVWNETKKNKKQLFFNWNHKCYYSGIFLNKDVPYNNPNYPVIDHKISVYFGFYNNIDFKIIGGLDNLCVCSRKMNGMKNILCEIDFIKKLNN
jgi:hypothetical protein